MMAGSEINSLYYKNNHLNKKNINAPLSTGPHKYRKSKNTLKKNPDYLVDISITARMKANHYSMVQALNNNKTSSQMLESIMGHLSQLTQIVQRISDQNIKLKNQSLSGEENRLIKIEISELVDQIDHIVSNATFNKINILKGDFSKKNPRASMWIQFGPAYEQRERIYFATMSSKAILPGNFQKIKLRRQNINNALSRIYNQQKIIKKISDKIKLQSKKIMADLYKLIKSQNTIIHDNEIVKLLQMYEDDYK